MTCKSDDVSKIAEDYVNFVVSETVPKSINLEEIQTETKNDSLLPMIMSAIKNNSWRTIEMQVLDCDKDAFKNIKLIKDEFSTNSDENVLLRGTRLVIPKALQKRIVHIAHEGHQGIVKTKQLIREKVWFWHRLSSYTYNTPVCTLSMYCSRLND